MRTCAECLVTKALTEFYANKNCVGGRNPRCKKCVRDRHAGGRAERAKRDRAYFQQIKLERGCTDCGYSSHPAALEFDHMPGSLKLYRIATMAGMKRTLIDEEIAKCEVVCANCHRVRTAKRLVAAGMQPTEAAETVTPVWARIQQPCSGLRRAPMGTATSSSPGGTPVTGVPPVTRRDDGLDQREH